MDHVIQIASGVSLVVMLVLGSSLSLGPACVAIILVRLRRALGLWFLTGAATRATDMLDLTLLYEFARIGNAVIGVLTASMILWTLWRSSRART